MLAFIAVKFGAGGKWATGRDFGVSTSSSARSSSTWRSPPRSPRRGQASSDVTGTSGSAPLVPAARTGSEEEARPEQDQAALTRSGYGAMMRRALAKIQEDAEVQAKAPFAKMKESMTGLMDLAYGKARHPNPPELPREFATRWPHDDSMCILFSENEASPLLPSLTEIPKLLLPFVKNECPITDKTLSQSSTAPNHHFCDMIAAWNLDHMAHSSASSTLPIPIAPSEEQIQDILRKFSGHSVMQEQALHEIQKTILDIGGMEMLLDLLKVEDAVVADALLECLMVSDDVLLLLDCLPKDSCVVDKMCDKAVELVNIIMAEQGTGYITPEVTYSAISLVHAIVKRNVHKVEKAKNLVDFKKRLSDLLSSGVPTHTIFHIKEIIKTLSVSFQSPAIISTK
ncbi:U-box domain-containing protein 73 [Dichanthelium oligosanthes]|uniref:U-box domain-containing protein 73 n=1 Tax=Dichanthelium oligosanthes TaxID=888268 RepID=A0A1E5VLJ2_9POAL|nr:U-box domain-containing protein 73 [Dichanthelium oligosanthes]